MAPTKEEEIKLKDYRGDVSELGSAERFLKAILDIPFAFKRIGRILRMKFESTGMDSDAHSGHVTKLETGLQKMQSEGDETQEIQDNFYGSMRMFVAEAEAT
ncbi:hypothetical protein L1987_05600 [Smallanthus sonchifolius]|uniref:Uncharacterized protein n=1 Tax=Smallanthus sonchifolius TaxID=185202 RepID=A0ACB9JVU4_9ASTR|nr:hypothetical protein L1987_05600 [Smallanthus sonchifolius]